MRAIAVAMSGGVDSSLAAWLLSRSGQEVIGLSLRLGFGPDQAWQEGAQVAADLGLAHHVVDVASFFEQRVLDPAIEAYKGGKTPNPCALCNALVKLPLLWQAAEKLGCERLATGHYARIVEQNGALMLAEGRDPKKSQAYFLARAAQSILEVLEFPLGGMTKAQVKKAAGEAGLASAGARESMDNCFLPPGGWDELMQSRGAVLAGPVEDAQGRVLARHGGIHRFTVGQRRGLGVAAGIPLYVLGLDGSRSAVTVGPAEALKVKGLIGSEPMWYAPPPFEEDIEVRHRYSRAAVKCRVSGHEKGVLVEFDEPIGAVAPGQLAVFYKGRLVLGSAWIEQTF